MSDTKFIIDDFSKLRIVCVGDIMLDRFVYGQVDRISPEAPIPVFVIKDEQVMLGGVGNVTRNLVSLGAHTILASVIGNDKTGRDIAAMVGREKNILPFLITETSRITTTKTRYVAGGHQVLRADHEVQNAISEDTQRTLLDSIKSELDNADAVILSDYGKGVLARKVLNTVIADAKAAGKPVIVDPKSRDFSIYSGATLISPNLNELANAAGREVHGDEEVTEAARHLMKTHDIANILVTRGKDGMTLVTKSEVYHIHSRAHEVFDVSGAGDTAIATIALGIAAGLPLAYSAELANMAAGVVVGKIGTAVITPQDLQTELFAHEKTAGTHKILTLSDAKTQVEKWRREGKKVGFTNGCFDIMHSGHLMMLNGTKSHCDRLIVGLNSDASVKRLKGEKRPVNSEIERALLLASLSVVDMVVIFSEDTPLNLLESLKPDVLAKGSDYQKHQVVGHELVEGYGGKVVLIPLKEGYSTTNIIKKMA